MKINFWIVAFMLLLTSAGQAECRHNFSVGVLTDSPYYDSAKPHNYATGLVRDLLEKVEKKVGCKFQETPLNYVRALQELKASRLDLFAFTARIPSWLEASDFKVVYTSTRALVIRKDIYKKDISLQGYLRNPKIKYGNLIGTTMFILPDEMEKLMKENRIVQSSTAAGVVQLVASGKAQAFFVTPVYLRFLQKDATFSNKFEVISDPQTGVDIGLYISKKRIPASEREQLTKAIDEMRADGTVLTILKKYVSAEDIAGYR
jgi:ABC-type amino acid transport substrate-binding protein